MSFFSRIAWRMHKKKLLFIIVVVIVWLYLPKNELSDFSSESVLAYIQHDLELSLLEDKGTGCDVPMLDPFSKEVTQLESKFEEIKCPIRNWVRCNFSECRIDQKLLESIKNATILCTYRDIVLITDMHYVIRPLTGLDGNQVYKLKESDHVKIKCALAGSIANNFSYDIFWEGIGVGYRPIEPLKSPQGRENTLNILIYAFDSTSKSGFIRRMPKSYKFIKDELGATILNKYNIVGDGTREAVFPILTGKSVAELPSSRQTLHNLSHHDHKQFLFHKLKTDGYRTAYHEDSCSTATFSYYLSGFDRPPTDHYLSMNVFRENVKLHTNKGSEKTHCVGDTPIYQLMMDLTTQFFKLEGKRFAFTLSSDVSHGKFSLITNADEPFVRFLSGMKRDGYLNNTLFIIMGDHGKRYGSDRHTYQSKLEERLPLMAIRLPEDLISQRPAAIKNLKNNVDTLTTPFDIYATLLDVLDMREHWNGFKIKGADFTRSMTVLEPIPRNRSCSEAGVRPHFCACLKWEIVPSSSHMYTRTAQALLDHINGFTEIHRSKCAVRTLTSIDWVNRKLASKRLLQYQKIYSETYFDVPKFGANTRLTKDLYQVKITTGPGNGVFEATVTYLIKEDQFYVNTDEISRTTAYGKEPDCIRRTDIKMLRHLTKFCYCIQ